MTIEASISTRGIFGLCGDLYPELSEQERVGQLKFILRQNPNLLHDAREDHSDRTPLHVAVYWERSLAFCKVLVENDTSPSSVRIATDNGHLPIHMACGSGNNIEMVRYLVGLFPESVRAANYQRQLPVHSACFAGNIQIIKYLFGQFPESIRAVNTFGELPIHVACKGYNIDKNYHGTLKTVKYLLELYPESVRATDGDGCLPLHVCARHQGGKNLVLIAKLLFDAYPRAISVENSDGKTPIDIARNANGSEMVSYLRAQLEFGQQPSIHHALQNPDVSLGAIKLIVEANPENLKMADEHGRLPLHIACQEGKCNIVNYILGRSEHGITMPNARGMQPIHLLLSSVDCDRNSLEYVEAIRCLLRLDPSVLPTLGMLPSTSCRSLRPLSSPSSQNNEEKCDDSGFFSTLALVVMGIALSMLVQSFLSCKQIQPWLQATVCDGV